MAAVRMNDRRFALRETLFVGLAGIGAWLFVNHEILRGGQAPSLDLSVYVVSTVVIYLFLRSLVMVAEMGRPRTHVALMECPECHQPLHDATAVGRGTHNRIELTPKPTEKAIVSAVALRRAVDATRFPGRVVDPREGTDRRAIRGAAENTSGKDLLDALRDPDLVDAILRIPNAPDDSRIKR